MNNTKSKELILEGLSCSSCAAKIQHQVNGISGVKQASLDFSTAKLRLEYEHPTALTTILEKTKTIIKQTEPDVNIVDPSLEAKIKPRSWFNRRLLVIMSALIFFALALLFNVTPESRYILYLIAYGISGYSILFKAARNLTKGEVFDENFLMSIATLGAFVIGEYAEGVAVMLFFQIGEYFQSLAVDRSRNSITALMNIRPDYAHKLEGDQTITTTPDLISIGDLILVKPGERIPLDGEIISGKSSLDTSALTGESLPRDVSPGVEVYSGFVNNSGVLTIKVTKSYQESTATKIIELMETAASKKAPTEKFITKFARYYTPVIVLLAVALATIPPLFIADASFNDWIYRALVFLIISCPCALVVSVPLSVFSGIGAASRHGILVKGGNFLEAFTEIDTIAFDKTGTLTKGDFQVSKIVTAGFSQDQLLEYAAYGESYSNHPIAQSILHAYNRKVDQSQIGDYQEIAGEGVAAIIKGKEVAIGNRKLMERYDLDYPDVDTIGTIVYIAVANQYVGYIVISDTLKQDTKDGIIQLKQLGIKNMVMVSGDNSQVANAIGRELGIDHVHGELLPEDKINVVSNLIDRGHKVAFVGDGINDAPVLARSNIGVAMGGLGSDAAIEAADVILISDKISQLPTTIRISRYTRKIVWQNIVFALGIKVVFLLLGAMGIATLWEAVFADVGVTILAVLNATRALRLKLPF